MTRTLWPVLFGAAAAVGGMLLFRGCDSTRTEIEQRVDSTLATVPAWEDSLRARDSVTAVRDAQLKREKAQRIADRLRADAAEAKADSLQAWADDLAEVPTNLSLPEQNQMLRTALAAQKQAAGQFRLLADSLKVHRSRDSLRLAEADATIDEQRLWLAQSEQRINRLTENLADLREETKHAGDWNLPLGIHLPGYVKDAVFIVGSAYGGYRVGKGS